MSGRDPRDKLRRSGRKESAIGMKEDGRRRWKDWFTASHPRRKKAALSVI